MEELLKYLETEGNYHLGVELLRKFSRNLAMVNTLSRRASDMNRAKLAYELEKLADRLGDNFESPEALRFIEAVHELQFMQPVPSFPEGGLPSGTTAENSEPVLPVAPVAPDAPVALTQEQQLAIAEYLELLTVEQTNIFTNRARLSNRLADAKQEERAAIVVEIERLTDQYNELAQRKQSVQESGQLPEPKVSEQPTAADVQPDKAALREQQLKLRPKVSRAKSKHEAKPDDATLATLYQKLRLELEQIDLALKNLS